MSTSAPPAAQPRAPRRRRRPLHLAQVAAIGYKKQRPLTHRAIHETRQQCQARYDELAAHLASLQVRLEALRAPPRIVGYAPGKSAEQVAREFARSPQYFLQHPFNLQPWPIQRAFVQHLEEMEAVPRYQSRGVILQAEIGLGKTLIVLLRIYQETRARVERGGARFGRPVLIVAPKSVYSQWVHEAQKFFPPDLMTHTALDSTGDTRELDPRRVMDCLDFVVVSYPTLTGAHRQRDTVGRHLFAVPWHRIVLDEGTLIVNDETHVFKACADIRAEYRLFVSGTPMPNVRSTEMNAILAFFGCQGIEMPRFGEPRRTSTAGEEDEEEELVATTDEEDTERVEQCRHILRQFCLGVGTVLARDPTLELPARVAALRRHETEVVWLDFSPDERALYQRLMDERHTHETIVWIRRLRHACNSFNLLQPEYAQPNPLQPSTKLRAMLDFEAERMLPGEKALVFSENLGILRELAGFLEARGVSYVMLCGDTTTVQRAQVVARVGDPASPDPRLTLISYRLGGLGIDGFQGSAAGGGANHVVFLETFWHPTLERQGLGRAERHGQMRHVHSVRFIIRDTIEEEVLARNQYKARMWSELTRHV